MAPMTMTCWLCVRRTDSGLVVSCRISVCHCSECCARCISVCHCSLSAAPVCRVWAFWVDPLAYAQKGMANTEFASARWQSAAAGGATVGDALLELRGIAKHEYSRWLGLGIPVSFAGKSQLLFWQLSSALLVEK